MGEDPVLIDFRAVEGAVVEEGKAPEGQLQRLPLATTLAADATAAAAAPESTVPDKSKSKKKKVVNTGKESSPRPQPTLT